MRIVPAATPVCSARSLIASFFTDRPDTLRRCARSGFPEPSSGSCNVRARSRSHPRHRRHRLRRLPARRRTARPRRTRPHPQPPRRGHGRRAHGRRALRPGPARGARGRRRPPTTSCTRWARAATSRPRTARPRSTSPRPRRRPASSASSTSAGSAPRTPSTCAAATRSRTLLRARLGDRLVYVRAAMIIGPGSASYDILEHLIQRLPVMIVPRWLDTKTQPIALSDVIAALADVGRARRRAGRAAARRRRGPDLS